MKRTVRTLARAGYQLYQKSTNKRFYDLARDAEGMMSPAIYRRIYDCIYHAADLCVVEVGGATGAGSIAAAWAMKESGKSSKLVVIEKCEGGSRSRFGAYEDNLVRMRRNFERFGVDDKIDLYPYELSFDSGEEVLKLIETREIAALILDADGRLDRDFFLFWPRLTPGGLIIVDDYVDQVNFQPISERHPRGGVKKRMTYRLLNQIRDWGLFRPSFQIRNTLFGIKPPDANFSRLDLGICQQIIDTLEDERASALGERRQSLRGPQSSRARRDAQRQSLPSSGSSQTDRV